MRPPACLPASPQDAQPWKGAAALCALASCQLSDGSLAASRAALVSAQRAVRLASAGGPAAVRVRALQRLALCAYRLADAHSCKAALDRVGELERAGESACAHQGAASASPDAPLLHAAPAQPGAEPLGGGAAADGVAQAGSEAARGGMTAAEEACGEGHGIVLLLLELRSERAARLQAELSAPPSRTDCAGSDASGGKRQARASAAAPSTLGAPPGSEAADTLDSAAIEAAAERRCCALLSSLRRCCTHDEVAAGGEGSLALARACADEVERLRARAVSLPWLSEFVAHALELLVQRTEQAAAAAAAAAGSRARAQPLRSRLSMAQLSSAAQPAGCGGGSAAGADGPSAQLAALAAESTRLLSALERCARVDKGASLTLLLQRGLHNELAGHGAHAHAQLRRCARLSAHCGRRWEQLRAQAELLRLEARGVRPNSELRRTGGAPRQAAELSPTSSGRGQMQHGRAWPPPPSPSSAPNCGAGVFRAMLGLGRPETAAAAARTALALELNSAVLELNSAVFTGGAPTSLGESSSGSESCSGSLSSK